MVKDFINLFKILIKHKYLFMFRKKSGSALIFTPVFTIVVILSFCNILKIVVPVEYAVSIPMIILISNYTLKYFFGSNSANVISYWTYPFRKGFVLSSFLLLEIIDLWTLYYHHLLFVVNELICRKWIKYHFFILLFELFPSYYI